LQGKTPVHLERPIAPKPRTEVREFDGRIPRKTGGIVGTGTIGRVDVPVLSPDETVLFTALRQRRKQLATEQGLPPYVIFHDSTLLAMAREKPRSLTALGELPGIGAAKLARYGTDFLSVISGHAGSPGAAQEHG
jgi:superfamily II DNA helicase RecQ